MNCNAGWQEGKISVVLEGAQFFIDREPQSSVEEKEKEAWLLIYDDSAVQ